MYLCMIASEGLAKDETERKFCVTNIYKDTLEYDSNNR